MKSPQPEKVNLPYASNVASFFGDQGSAQSDSFMGRFFKTGARTIVTQGEPAAPNTARAPQTGATMGGGGFSGSAVRTR